MSMAMMQSTQRGNSRAATAPCRCPVNQTDWIGIRGRVVVWREIGFNS